MSHAMEYQDFLEYSRADLIPIALNPGLELGNTGGFCASDAGPNL